MSYFVVPPISSNAIQAHLQGFQSLVLQYHPIESFWKSMALHRFCLFLNIQWRFAYLFHHHAPREPIISFSKNTSSLASTGILSPKIPSNTMRAHLLDIFQAVSRLCSRPTHSITTSTPISCGSQYLFYGIIQCINGLGCTQFFSKFESFFTYCN